MKKTILVRSIVVGLLLLFRVSAPSVPANGQSPQDALKPFLGKWRAMLSFVQAGGRFTVSLAEETEVNGIGQNTIEFSINQLPVGSLCSKQRSLIKPPVRRIC